MVSKVEPNTMEIIKEPARPNDRVPGPASVLRKKAADIAVADIKSSRIQGLIEAMKETLRHTPDGVGLAAPQVGASLKIFIISEEAEEIDRVETEQKKRGVKKRDPDEPPYEKRPWKYYVFINPVIKNISRKMRDDAEGCLSVPKKYGVVVRHEKITVEACDEYGKKITRGSSRFFARVLQHELDHLEGTLFIDKVKKFIDVHRGK
jgi:peptide deformylase